MFTGSGLVALATSVQGPLTLSADCNVPTLGDQEIVAWLPERVMWSTSRPTVSS